MQINKVLFPTDFSRCADQALLHALFFAQQYNAELHMLHAVVLHEDDPHNPSYHFPNKEEINKQIEEIAQTDMKNALKTHKAEELITKREQRWGVSPAPVILEYVVEKKIDLISIL